MARKTASTPAGDTTAQPEAADSTAAAPDEEPTTPEERPDDTVAPAAPDQAEASAADTDEPDSAADDAPEQLPPGVYEYVAGIGCVYPHVPLTCRAFHPAVAATDTSPEIPERAATVFEWLDGPPADGRWAPTEKPPTQVADNCGGLLNGKE